MSLLYLHSTPNFVIDFVYTILAVVLCFAIFFKTRESYMLTKHKGIGYFRDAFLFLGVSYLLRFVFSALIISTLGFMPFPRFDISLTLLFIVLVSYFSTVAILYLIYSNIWKSDKGNYTIVFMHILAILLAVFSFITRSPGLLALLQLLLLIVAVILSFTSRREKKEGARGMRTLYILILVFWLMSLGFSDQHRIVSIYLWPIIILQTISIIVLGTVYYKVSRWLR